MSEALRNACERYKMKLEVLNGLRSELSQALIIRELSCELGVQIHVGRNVFRGRTWLEEAIIKGESLTLMHVNKGCSYVLYTVREYYEDGVGFAYDDDIIVAHASNAAENIQRKYCDSKINEITDLIEECSRQVDADIAYLHQNTAFEAHDHYYGEDNHGFPSRLRFETISDVVDDFKGSSL